MKKRDEMAKLVASLPSSQSTYPSSLAEICLVQPPAGSGDATLRCLDFQEHPEMCWMVRKGH